MDKKKQYDCVERLAGGEENRLYLCAVLNQNPNFLILDEPTNDLYVVTLNVVESFLLDFPGNLLVVSHDRYFMDKIVDSLFVFRGDAKIEHFPGNYSDFRSYEDSAPVQQVDKVVKKAKAIVNTSSKNKLSYNEQREFDKLEKEISKLGSQRIDIESKFANGEIETDKINDTSQELQNIIDKIEQKEERWLELSMQLEG